MNIKHINNFDFFSNEIPEGDIIFNGSAVGGNTQPIYLDNEYNNTDYKLYAFSTMGKNIKMVNSRNMVLPIREKNSINHPQTYHTILDNLNIDKLEDGIYLVEYYSFNAVMSQAEEHNIAKYYKHIDNLTYSERTINRIKDFINIVFKENGLDVVAGSKGLRIVSYIPKSQLIEHTCVYSTSTDILLVYGNVNEYTKHPSTYTKTDLVETEYTECSEVIASIELVDNSTNESKWMMIGNEIIKIMPIKDSTKPSGATLSISRNNVNIFNKTVDIEELTSLGLYETKDKVKAKNDPNVMLAVQEVEFKKKELEFKYNKLVADKEALISDVELYKEKIKNEKEKYENEIAKLKLELEQKKTIFEMDIEKTILNDQLSFTKEVRKVEHEARKYEQDLVKGRMDVQKAAYALEKVKFENKVKVAKGIYDFFRK